MCQVDRPSVTEQRCDEVQSNLFDLFAHLGATDEQLDFTTLYASAREVRQSEPSDTTAHKAACRVHYACLPVNSTFSLHLGIRHTHYALPAAGLLLCHVLVHMQSGFAECTLWWLLLSDVIV